MKYDGTRSEGKKIREGMMEKVGHRHSPAIKYNKL